MKKIFNTLLGHLNTPNTTDNPNSSKETSQSKEKKEELMEVISFLSKVGELILQMRYDYNHLQMNQLFLQNDQKKDQHSGRYGFQLRQEYYGLMKTLSEIYSKQLSGNRYCNIQFFLQRKADGYNFLVESWEFEILDLNLEKNKDKHLIKKDSKIAKEKVITNLSILAKQIAVFLVESRLWVDYIKIDKNDLLFQTFKLKHFLDYKVTYFQPTNATSSWLKDGDETYNQINELKSVQIGKDLRLNAKIVQISEMSLLRKVPILNKNQMKQNINPSNVSNNSNNKRTRYMSDDIFNNNQPMQVRDFKKQHDTNQNNNANNNKNNQRGSFFNQKGEKVLSCGKLDDKERKSSNGTDHSQQHGHERRKSSNNSSDQKNQQLIDPNYHMENQKKSHKPLLNIEDTDLNIEIVQRTNIYDSIVSVYSKKEDVTIISTPEDVHLQAPFNKDSGDLEDESDQEFEMCGANLDDNLDQNYSNENLQMDNLSKHKCRCETNLETEYEENIDEKFDNVFNNISSTNLSSNCNTMSNKKLMDKLSLNINNSNSNNDQGQKGDSTHFQQEYGPQSQVENHKTKFKNFMESILQVIDLQFIENEGDPTYVMAEQDLISVLDQFDEYEKMDEQMQEA